MAAAEDNTRLDRFHLSSMPDILRYVPKRMQISPPTCRLKAFRQVDPNRFVLPWAER